MKKLISLLLATVLVLSLCACGAAEQKESAGLQVGYGREKIMPDAPVPLDGYGNNHLRISENTLDLLYATCVAFRDGEETVLMFSIDLMLPKVDLVSTARDRVFKATGIPKDKMMFCFSHTHSAPDVTKTDDPAIQRYKETFWKGVEKAAQTALSDLSSAKLMGTKVITEGMNFVRHYLMNDGTYYGSNFGSAASGFKDYAMEKDPEMLLVKIEREGEKKDILLMNFGGHPTRTGGNTKYDISADYVGSTRMVVERDSDMLFAFYQGAGGNQNTATQMPGETYEDDYLKLGENMGKLILDSVANMQPIEGSGIKTYQVMFEQPVCHDDEELQAEAREVYDLWTSTGDRDVGNKRALELGLRSVYHAAGILARPSRPQSDTMEINAITIGGMAFVTAPYEMFSVNCMAIKENSPYDMTFVATCSNENHWYTPSAEAYDYSCYESNVCYFAKGAAEATSEKLVEMLNGLKG